MLRGLNPHRTPGVPTMKRLVSLAVLLVSALALAADPPAAAPAEEKKTEGKKKGSHCKVMDEAGAVVVEHDSEGSTIKCQSEIREKVKGEKCEPGKKLAYQYVGESAPGKEGKPIAMNITCSKK
jgi:hypothetical protein